MCIVFLLLILRLKVDVSTVPNDLPFEVQFASLEGLLQHLIIIDEYNVKYHILQSRLHLQEEMRVLNKHRILPNLGIIKLVHTIVNVWVKLTILHQLVNLHEPVVEFLLLLRYKIRRAETQQQLLKRANHIPKEANADHLDYELKQVLFDGVAGDITVSDRGKGGYHPVDGGDSAASVESEENVWEL